MGGSMNLFELAWWPVRSAILRLDLKLQNDYKEVQGRKIFLKLEFSMILRLNAKMNPLKLIRIDQIQFQKD